MAAIHEVDVREGDTRPILEWTMKDKNKVVIDMTAGSRKATLYYQAERSDTTLWKIDLTKVAPETAGVMRFVADVGHPYRPSGLVGIRKFVAFIVYTDTADGTVSTLEGALEAKTHPRLAEP